MPQPELVSVRQLFVEVHHERGNFSKFEMEYDKNNWGEESVWDFRRVPEEYWRFWDRLESIGGGLDVFRVTRYPDLEKDVLDNTYHPSVPSWKINADKVKEFFDGK